MILKNESGMKRNVNILFKVNKEEKEYIVYEDYNTKKVYGGKISKNMLKSLNEKEYEYLNRMYEKMRIE